MGKLAIGLLALFRRISLPVRRLRGKTPADVAARRVTSGRSWNEFCDALKAAGAALSFPGAPRDSFNQAEGYRYLSRLARAGLMAFVEHADPRVRAKQQPQPRTRLVKLDSLPKVPQGEIDLAVGGTA